MRAAGENRALTGDEIRNLATSKATGDYEAEAVPGATLADFDDEIVAEYLAKREARTRRKLDVDGTDAHGAMPLLKDIGALDRHGHPTVAGILLFASLSN